MNITVIAALIAAIAAIIAPMLTALINNRHQIKMANNELFIKRRIDVIEKYIYNVGKFSADYRTRCLDDFAEVQGIIFLYVPKLYWDDITKLNHLVNEHNESAIDQLAVVSQKLSVYLESIRTEKLGRKRTIQLSNRHK